MPTCTACGAANPDDARFCGTCGSGLAAPAPPPPGAPVGLPTYPSTPPSPAPYPGPAAPGAVQRPTGVTIVAVLCFLLGGLAVIAGLWSVAAGPVLLSSPEFRQAMLDSGMPPDVMASIFAIVGVFILVLAVVYLLVGWGLWKGTGWGWTLVMAFTVFWVVMGVLQLPLGIVTIAIAGFLLWYFTRDGVKRYFGRVSGASPGMPGYVPPPG